MTDHEAPGHDRAYCPTCDNVERAPEYEALTKRLQELLDHHAPAGGWAARAHLLPNMVGVNAQGVRPGRWNCRCGESGTLGVGERIGATHRLHQAQQLALALLEG